MTFSELISKASPPQVGVEASLGVFADVAKKFASDTKNLCINAPSRLYVVLPLADVRSITAPTGLNILQRVKRCFEGI
jgi:hypothetical protein